MRHAGTSRYFGVAVTGICLSLPAACARHATDEHDMDASTARVADSTRSVQAARSRSSASQVFDFDSEERTHYSRVEQMIQAHFTGVQVISLGGSYAIRIRGSGSLGAGNDPLVIIDGANRGVGELRSINPLDVKRIEIMKDGAASFYGSRGANGVIIITTGREP